MSCLRPLTTQSRVVAGVLVGLAGLVAGCGTPSGGRPASEQSAEPGRATASLTPDSPTTVATAGAIPAGDGPVEAGTYRIPKSAWSVVEFTVTMPKGWTVQYGHVYHKHQDNDDEIGVYAVIVDAIFTDACDEEVLAEVGPSADDLAAALLRQSGPVASGPVDTSFGGHPAIRIDLTVPGDLDLEGCRLEGAGLQVWYSPPADKHLLLPDGIASVYILDVAGQRQVFLTQHRSTTSQKDLAELRTVLESIHIES